MSEKVIGSHISSRLEFCFLWVCGQGMRQVIQTDENIPGRQSSDASGTVVLNIYLLLLAMRGQPVAEERSSNVVSSVRMSSQNNQ